MVDHTLRRMTRRLPSWGLVPASRFFILKMQLKPRLSQPFRLRLVMVCYHFSDMQISSHLQLSHFEFLWPDPWPSPCGYCQQQSFEQHANCRHYRNDSDCSHICFYLYILPVFKPHWIEDFIRCVTSIFYKYIYICIYINIYLRVGYKDKSHLFF